MSINLKIVLIEDKKIDSDMIIKRLTETVEWLKGKDFLLEMNFDSITIVAVRGSDKKKKKGIWHYYYKNTDILRIDAELKETKENEIVGILSDILLTKEEDDKASVNDFAEITMVNKICESFEGKYPIYFITSVHTFGSRAWGILGKEKLISHYVQKELVDMPSKKAIARVLYWLANSKEIPIELSARIEEKEIEDYNEPND